MGTNSARTEFDGPRSNEGGPEVALHGVPGRRHGTVAARKIALSTSIRIYLREFVGIDPTPSTLREFRMEEVFKDVSYDFRETPGNDVALNAYIDLVDLYLRVLRETTNWLARLKRRGGPIGRLLDAAGKGADSLSALTFNHDLVLENEIERRAKLRARWCLDQGDADQ